jgi:aminoglycoside 6'-N-acetyltransferase
MTAVRVPHAAYRFRPLSAPDLALVHGWQRAPHVREWWDGEPIELAGADEAELAQYMVASEARPFAYLQCYLQGTCAENGLGLHPVGTRGIDQFIGEPDMVGRGHGSAFLRAFVEGLLAAGVPRVLTDPSVRNARAIRAYAKAGFRSEREVDTPDGRALLMLRDVSAGDERRAGEAGDAGRD